MVEQHCNAGSNVTRELPSTRLRAATKQCMYRMELITPRVLVTMDPDQSACREKQKTIIGSMAEPGYAKRHAPTATW